MMRLNHRVGVAIDRVTMPTSISATLRASFNRQWDRTVRAGNIPISTRRGRHFGQLLAGRAVPHEGRMPIVLRDEIARKEVVGGTARHTVILLDPEEILHGRGCAAVRAPRLVKIADLTLDTGHDALRFGVESGEVKRRKCLTYGPVRHGINIRSHNTCAESIGLDDRRAAAHKRIGYQLVMEVVSPVKRLRK